MLVVEVPRGHSLLLDGPAKVSVLSGECSVFGAKIKELEVPENKRVALKGACKLLIEGGTLSLVQGSTIPEDWNLSVKGKVLILGEMDSGKSVLCTFLINRQIYDGKRVVFLDLDCGQSDLGPPGTLAYARVKNPVPILQNLTYDNFFFFGATSPTGWEEWFVTGTAKLLKEIEDYDTLIINTPGWTSGRGIQLLESLIELIEPDHVLSLGDVGIRATVLPPSPHARTRKRAERLSVRNYLYRRYLKDLKEIFIPYERIKLPCGWLEEWRCLGKSYNLTPEGLEGFLGALFKGSRGVGFCLIKKLEEEGIRALGTTEDFEYARFGKIKLNPETLEEELLLI